MTDWLQAHGLSPELQTKLLLTAITIVALWAVHRIVLGLAYRRATDPWTRYRWRKGVTYVTLGVGIVLVGHTWVAGMQSVVTFFGLLSAGLAISHKDPVANLAAWAYIMWRRPFEVGERVQIGPHAGDVIDLRLFQFTLNEIGNWVDADQSTGRIIHIPNGKVLTDVIANYSEGFEYIWNEIPVLITFESDWEKAKQLLLEIVTRDSADIVKAAEESVRQTTRKFMIFYTNLTPTVYTSVAEDGVKLTLRYLVQPRRRRVTEQKIWEDILREVAKHDDIDFAYITRRAFNNLTEGKISPADQSVREGVRTTE